MNKQSKKSAALLIGSALLGTTFFSSGVLAKSEEPTRLMRFADIYKDKVTFVYSGDIYIADINSGKATRLTSHHGMETFPKFSRDGQQIAFAAEFNGSRRTAVTSSK